MKYFAVMYDGSIKTVSVDSVSKYTLGRIYFKVDEDYYKYNPYDDYPSRICVYRNPSNFYRFMNNDWYVSRQIRYLLELDETEDKELNYFQSTDFNAGYIYNKIERSIAPLLKENLATAVTSDMQIPAIQLLPKGCDSVQVQEEETINVTKKAVIEHFDAVYGKSFKLHIYDVKKDKQHIVLSYSIQRKEQYKEMTIAEIEEALGYKIKVVK